MKVARQQAYSLNSRKLGSLVFNFSSYVSWSLLHET